VRPARLVIEVLKGFQVSVGIEERADVREGDAAILLEDGSAVRAFRASFSAFPISTSAFTLPSATRRAAWFSIRCC
jgi:hypothetical protein